MDRIALVTGANRGTGLEVVKQLADHSITVILGSRDAQKGDQAAQSLGREKVTAHQLDTQQHYLCHLGLEPRLQRGALCAGVPGTRALPMHATSQARAHPA